MKLNIETLIEIIVKEVLSELKKIGIDKDVAVNVKPDQYDKSKKQHIDMSGYKTPVLTENILMSLKDNIDEIIIPEGTIFTPGARDILKKRKLIINYN